MQFLFQWINFILLAAILVYALKKPLKDFLSNRREAVRMLIGKSQEAHAAAKKNFEESKTKMKNAAKDAAALENSMIATGTYARDAALSRANELVERLDKETAIMMKQEAEKAASSIFNYVMKQAFNEARDTLRTKITPEQQTKLINETIETLKTSNLNYHDEGVLK